MPRLRTLNETLKYVKELDPQTALTANALRRMVVSGQMPHIKAGKKYLVDLDLLFEYLKGCRAKETMPEPDTSFDWRVE